MTWGCLDHRCYQLILALKKFDAEISANMSKTSTTSEQERGKEVEHWKKTQLQHGDCLAIRVLKTLMASSTDVHMT